MKATSTKNSLLFLLILILLTNVDAFRPIKGVALINYPLVQSNGTGLTGFLYEVFQEICAEGNLNYTYTTQDLLRLNESLPKYVGNDSLDFVLGYPVLANDLDFDLRYQNLTKISFLQERMYIFRPNLLQALVINVLREMFFVTVIILLPWFLVNISIYYLIEIRQFYKLDFFTGFYEAFKSIVYTRKRMNRCAKIYSVVFFLLTAIVSMLLLGDFIYVIAAMLLKSTDVDNINEFLNSQSKTCSIEDDFLVNEFLSKRQEIAVVKAPDPLACFTQLSTFDVGTFLISEYRIKDFFKQYPKQNNIFAFFIKDSISVDYHLLLNSDLRLGGFFQNMLDSLGQRFIPTVEDDEFTDPVFNKISPSSIFSDSILLIFTSLTVTSVFLIFFLIVMIFRQNKRPIHRHIKLKEKGSNKKNQGEKRYELARQTERNHGRALDLESQEPRDRRNNIKNGQQNQQNQKQGQRQAGPVQNAPVRNMIMNANINMNAVSQNNNANSNKTLSLSGPIQVKKFEGKPDKSWLKLDAQSSRAEGSFKFQGTSDFENQLSPVEKADDTEKSKHNAFDLEGVEHRDKV